MKELSIKEKARHYDEAIEKLHEIITMDNKPVNPKEMGEYLFPELKESDDERIKEALRKRIIRYDPNNEILIKEEGISQKQFLAWLEKQGEQKTTWKPTEEQIEALEHLLETIRRHEYSYFHEEKFLSLHSLLEQLKKL